METLVQLTQALASTRDVRGALAAAVASLAESLGANNCSIVRMARGDRTGQLVATNAARAGSARASSTAQPAPAVDLEREPAIGRVLESGEPLLVPASIEHALLGATPAAVASTQGSCFIAPIRHAGVVQGVLHLWFAAPRSFEPEELRMLQGVAHALGLVLERWEQAPAGGAALAKPSQAKAPAAATHGEARIKSFRPYAQFFDGAADGMVVIDHRGRLLLSNPRVREMTGYAVSELHEARIQRFLRKRELARMSRVVRGLGQGIYPHGVDVHVKHKAGHELVLSVSFSSVLSEERAILLTFRDVTLERKTEVELRRTTEFLHRVIDSSVDAIVSADMRGRVLLFNRAAARIFGYEPTDVIGKMNVERLYPPGVAREVMRRIRSPQHGGKFRLEDYRVNMLGSDGVLIPVNISAALMLEQDKPAGSVGVFTDVREKLRMEERLSKAQEELRQHERSLALAELAGTTAHELNQPLTGVIGYAELLLKRLDGTSPLRGAAEVILSEAERMAEIVRKIGKITKYETRSYVGEVNILDLEKAAPNADEIE